MARNPNKSFRCVEQRNFCHRSIGKTFFLSLKIFSTKVFRFKENRSSTLIDFSFSDGRILDQNSSRFSANVFRDFLLRKFLNFLTKLFFQTLFSEDAIFEVYFRLKLPSRTTEQDDTSILRYWIKKSVEIFTFRLKKIQLKSLEKMFLLRNLKIYPIDPFVDAFKSRKNADSSEKDVLSRLSGNRRKVSTLTNRTALLE